MIIQLIQDNSSSSNAAIMGNDLSSHINDRGNNGRCSANDATSAITPTTAQAQGGVDMAPEEEVAPPATATLPIVAAMVDGEVATIAPHVVDMLTPSQRNEKRKGFELNAELCRSPKRIWTYVHALDRE